MKFKIKKFFLLSTIFILLLFSLSLVINFSSSFNKSIVYLKKYVPLPIKIYLKENFFSDLIKEENLKLKEEVFNLERSVRFLENQYLDLQSQINGVKTNKFKYKLIRYQLPFHQAKNWGTKSVSYLEEYENKIIYTTGNGQIFYSDLDTLVNKKELELNKINTNLDQIIKDPAFWDLDEKVNVTLSKIDEKIAGRSGILGNMIGVTSILIDKNYFYLAYVQEIKKYCYHIGLLRAEMNFKKMFFEEFLDHTNPDECARADILNNDYSFNGKVSGGKLSTYKDEKILLSIGSFGLMENLFDDNNKFGKIIEIDTKTKKTKSLSKGHRNQQGLIYHQKNDMILSTEHGPKGGDEINIINEGKNYGWPDASYGIEYNPYLQAVGLKKSHKEHGYEEPVYYFSTSIGISDIIEIPANFDPSIEKDFLVGSLTGSATYGNTLANERYTNNKTAGRSLFRVSFNEKFSKIKEVERIYLGDRIRDIHYIENNNFFLLLFEEQPAIGIFEKF